MSNVVSQLLTSPRKSLASSVCMEFPPSVWLERPKFTKNKCGTALMSPVFPCLLCSWGITHFKQSKTMPNNLRAIAFNSQRLFHVKVYLYIILKGQEKRQALLIPSKQVEYSTMNKWCWKWS